MKDSLYNIEMDRKNYRVCSLSCIKYGSWYLKKCNKIMEMYKNAMMGIVGGNKLWKKLSNS